MSSRHPFALRSFATATAAVALAISAGGLARADTPSRALLTAPIDETRMVTIEGNVRPEVGTGRDLGRLSDSYKFPSLFLQLQRSPEREAALEAYLETVNTRGAPNFHQWFTPQSLDAQYGVDPRDLAKIKSWLASHGIKVNGYSPNMVLEVSATAGQLRAAFGVEIHRIMAKGAVHIANVNDPSVPEALRPVLLGPVSLSDFMPHMEAKKVPSWRQRRNDPFYNAGGGNEAIVPADLQTIYNMNPLYTQGITGKGQTIVLIEDVDLYTAGDWYAFRKVLGLSREYPLGTFATVHPTGSATCTDPGDNSSADVEAAIDVEWASAAAPNAAIQLQSCKDTTVFGGFVALQNSLTQAGHPDIFSISYGESEPSEGATNNAYINTLYQTAASEGASVFVSSGDEGANSSDADATSADHGITVSSFASPQYDVAVGGTDFADTYLGTNANYWSGSNNPLTFASALSYIPEIPWNDTCAGALFQTNFIASVGSTWTAGTFTGTISGTTLTVTAVANGDIWTGETLAGAGIGAGVTITSQLTSTEPGNVVFGTGTYRISTTETVATPETMTGTYFGLTASTASLCNNALLVEAEYTYTGGGSGGPSNCATGTASTRGVANGTCKGYAKPSYQSVFGNPADSVRDIPDVSLFASNGFWGHYYVLCYSHTKYDGVSCADNPSLWPGYGGTSISTPIMAAIQALVNEKTGQSWGNPDPVYYSMARTEYGASGNASCNSEAGGGPSSACTFYDVTLGDMVQACKKDGSSTFNCYITGTTYGGTSVSNSAFTPQAAGTFGASTAGGGAYGATTGWDFATGIGTVNAYNFVNNPAW